MNFKVTLALIAVAAIAGAVYFLNPFEKEEEKALPRPWFYQVSVDDMTKSVARLLLSVNTSQKFR